MGDNDQPTGGPHFVGKKNELIEAKRSFRILEGREILIIYNEGVFHAMDAFCYREYSQHSLALMIIKSVSSQQGNNVLQALCLLCNTLISYHLNRWGTSAGTWRHWGEGYIWL